MTAPRAPDRPSKVPTDPGREVRVSRSRAVMSAAYTVPDGEEEPAAPPFDETPLLDEAGLPRWMPELVLGVPLGASEDAVRSARRRLQRRFHPDRPTGDAGASRLVNAAADILLQHRVAYQVWLQKEGVALQLARAAVAAPPSALSDLEDAARRATLSTLLECRIEEEARRTRQRRSYREALRQARHASARAEQRVRQAEEAIQEVGRQLQEALGELDQQKAANAAQREQLAQLEARRQEQLEVALAGQLAELRASEHAVMRAARTEAAERVAATERAAHAADTAARTQAAEEAAAARAEVVSVRDQAAAQVAVAERAAQSEVAAARAEAAAAHAEAAAARAEAVSVRDQAAAQVAVAERAAQSEVAAARAEAAAARAEAEELAGRAATASGGQLMGLALQCLQAIREGRVNSAIRRKAEYVVEHYEK